MIRYSLVFFAGFVSGTALLFSSTLFPSAEVSADCFQQFSLTNKNIECEEYAEARDRMQNLSRLFEEKEAELKSQKKITRMSVWVRDLNTRQWAALNYLEQYIPASLMKVPLMLVFYKAAEFDPGLLQRTIVYNESDSREQYVPPEQALTPGTAYTVDALINHMIRYSDNSVLHLLANEIDPAVFVNTLSELGLQVVSDSDTVNFVTVKTYANVFRTLYNASYLNRELSQKALTLLTSTHYKGIAEPLPSSVTVAHKFGERPLVDAQNTLKTVQLHDCGIVYKKERPYSLCIMTEGDDFNELDSVIKEISKLVYDNM